MIQNESNTGMLGQQSANSGSAGGSTSSQDTGAFDLHSYLGGMTSEFVSGGTGGDVFVKFRDNVTEVIKALTKPNMLHRVIPVNREDYTEMKFSFLVIASQLKGKDTVTAYHILILEGTGEKLKSDMANIDQRQVVINRVTGHAYDTRMQSLAAEIVKAAFPSSQCYSTAAEVIRSSVDPEKDTTKVKDIAKNAVLACLSKLAQVLNMNKPFQLDKVGTNYRFLLELANNTQGVVYDEQGSPIRSSAIITFSSEKRGITARPTDDIVNKPDALERICEVSGFVNTIWAPSYNNVGFGFNNMAPGMQFGPNGFPVLPSQKLAAEFVITGIRTPYGTSTAAVMLAISTKLLASDHNNWMQLIIPRVLMSPGYRNPVTGRNQPLDDLGALNVIVNFTNETDKNGFGTPVDMSAMAGKLSEISRYLTTIFRQGLVTSIDVPECGPQSWYLNVFGRAAAGDKAARQEIIAAANEITAGRFDQFFDPNAPIFTSSIRVPLGHYLVGDQLRDIRDIDLTAICSLYRNNPEQIHTWTRAFSDPNLNWMTKLGMVEEMVKHALHDQCEINGYAQRCTFSSAFDKAFSAAFGSLNLQTSLMTPLSGEQLQNGVAAPSYIDQSLTQNTATFNNMGNFNGPVSFASGMNNRFF